MRATITTVIPEMKTTDIDSLGTVAADVAMRAAAEYLRSHKLEVNVDALVISLRAWCKRQLPVALEDAREAYQCGMVQAAEATFKLSMAKAGIEAAKECGFQKS